MVQLKQIDKRFIMALLKTWLTENDDLDSCNIHLYTLFHKHREGKARSGIGFYVKNIFEKVFKSEINLSIGATLSSQPGATSSLWINFTTLATAVKLHFLMTLNSY